MRAVKYMLLAGVASFFLVGAFGFAQVGMGMDSTGDMSGCPLMGIPALCHMSPLEHAFMLQNVFTAVPSTGMFAFLISILLALSIVFLTPLLRGVDISLFKPPLHLLTRKRGTIPRHSLQEAFSNGILHSKAF